jgi:cellulose synthase operon protein C
VRTLVFPGEEALLVALGSGLVPEEVHSAPAQVFPGEAAGELRLVAPGSLPLGLAEKLLGAGVRVVDERSIAAARRRGAGRAVRCWAEAVPVRAASSSDGLEPRSGATLFLLPDGTSALRTAGELLRLGCDRQECCFGATGSASMIRAVDAPYYTVACAAELDDGPRAFVPAATEAERVWLEVGHRHPLAASLRAPEGELLLLPSRGPWITVPDGPWTSVYEIVELRLPGDGRRGRACEPGAPPAPLVVTLRLGRDVREPPPTLWVVEKGAVAELERLVRTLHEDVVARLRVAAAAGPDPTVVLRARLGRESPPELVLRGLGYSPAPSVRNLYVPVGSLVEPPVRPERLRAILAPDPDRVHWLSPVEDLAPSCPGAFRVESLPESAFHPLLDWVEYVVHSQAALLEPWVRASVFEFDAFESIGCEWSDGPTPRESEEARRKRRTPGHRVGPLEEPGSVRLPGGAGRVRLALAGVEPSTEESAEETRLAEEALASLEREFLEDSSAVDAPSRRGHWERMAAANVRLGRGRDAGLCFTRALWELRGDEASEVAERWALAEVQLAGAGDGEALARALLGSDAPGPDGARALSALLTLSALGAREQSGSDLAGSHLQEAQLWLEAHDPELDVRSLWLGRAALARLSGGDRLGLSRARDRVLSRLGRGLSVERDVPAFLRFCGRGTAAARDTAAVGRLAEGLEGLLDYFTRTKRKTAAVEAAPHLTEAYVRHAFAYGFARLGRPERARALRAEVDAALDLRDPIHGYLSRAFAARVDQALEGLPADTPLPSTIAGELNEMPKLLRYKVDRLRQVSTILEPQEHLDPITAFSSGVRDPRGDEFEELRGMTDLDRLAAEVDRLMERACASAPDERARLFDGLMDFLPLLPESRSLPHLQRLVGSIDDVTRPRRVLLLEEALMLAGFFGRPELARDLAGRLKSLVVELAPGEAAAAGGMLGICLRGLRRVGLHEEAALLLETIGAALDREDPEALVVRLQLAAGLASLGRIEQARAIFEEADAALRGPLLAPARLRIARALASALAQAPRDEALLGLGRLAGHLTLVTDSYNTNTHFCLSVIQFMEGLILGYASEDLALGDLGRRWLEEDEHLVRRRVHRDLAELEAAPPDRRDPR